jgi:hypothetical protein
MDMQRSELIRSLLTQNIALTRELHEVYSYMRELRTTLHAVEAEGKESGIVRLDEINRIHKDIHDICKAVADRELRRTGRMDHPSPEELGKLARADSQIDTMHFMLPNGFDSQVMNAIFDKIFKDIESLGKKADGLGDKPKNNFYSFPPKMDWKKNFGGDLEGEWQDYREEDQEPPQNPFAGAD